MATTTALVTQLSGQAWIRGTDGSLTAIHEGSRIPVGAEVVTASGSTVQLQVDGQPPITLGENREFLFSQDVAQNNVDPSEAAVAAPSDPVVDTIIAALNAGADPFAELDPTAAVLTGGGGEGGASFTRLLSIVENTTPLSLDYPRPTLPGQDDVRLSGFGGEAATDDSGTITPAGSDAPVVPPLPAPPTVVIADNNSVQAGQLTIAEDAAAPASGAFTVTTPGGLAFLTVGSLTLTAAQVNALGQPGATPVEIDTDKGKLVLTSFDAATGKFSYDYVVDGAQDHSAGDDSVIDAIPITVTDSSGQQTSGTLGVLITDTNPAALIDDGGSLTEDAALSIIGGNVLDNDQAFDAPKSLQSWEEVANKDVIDQLAQLGTLNLNPDGTWSFELDSSLDAVQALTAGETKVFTLQYIMKDADGDTSNSTLSFTIVGANDLAVVTPDAQSVTEDVNVNLAGQLTVEGAVTITDDDAGESVFDVSSLTFTGTDAVGGARLGSIAMNADGTYTYSVDNAAVQYLNATESIVETYTVQSADGTGTSVITITIHGANDAPVIDTQSSVLAVSVSEEGLANGQSNAAVGEIDTTDSLTASGTVVFSDPDTTGGHSVTLTAPPVTDVYTSNGSTVHWELLNSGKTLNGFILDGGTRTPIVSVTIDDGGAYTATLSGPIDHPVNPTEDVLGLNIGVVVADATGLTDTTTLTINIEDDSPVITPTSPVVVTDDGVPDVFTGLIDFTGTGGTQNSFSFGGGAVLVTGKGFTSSTDLNLVDAPLGQTSLGLGVASTASPNHNLPNEVEFRVTEDGQAASEEMTISLTAGKVAYGLSIEFAQMYGGETESGVAMFYRGTTLIATIPFTSNIGDGHYAADFTVSEGGFDRVVIQATGNGNGALQDNSDFTIQSVEFLGSPTPQPIAYATDNLDVAYGADGAGKTGGIALTGAEEGLKTANDLDVTSTVVSATLIQGHDSTGALVYELHLTPSTGQWELFQYQPLAAGNDGLIDFTFKATDADGDGKDGVFQVVPVHPGDGPTLSIDSVEVIEGVDDYATFTVSLSHVTSHDIAFDLALVSGTATTDDYSGLQVFNGTTWEDATSAVIAAGQTSVQVRTAIIDDALRESAENFTLHASVTDGVVANQQADGTGTILDVFVSGMSAGSFLEGQEVVFNITLNNPAGQETHFDFRFAGASSTSLNYTAADSQDYDISNLHFSDGVTFVMTGANTGTFTIPAGVSTFSAHMPTINDSDVEGNEGLRMYIIGGGGNINRTGIILDNDVEPLNDSTDTQAAALNHLAPSDHGALAFNDVLGDGDASGGDLLQLLPAAQATQAHTATTGESSALHGQSGTDRVTGSASDSGEDGNQDGHGGGGVGNHGAHDNQMVIDQIDMGGDHGQAQMVSQMIEQGKLKVDSAS